MNYSSSHLHAFIGLHCHLKSSCTPTAKYIIHISYFNIPTGNRRPVDIYLVWVFFWTDQRHLIISQQHLSQTNRNVLLLPLPLELYNYGKNVAQFLFNKIFSVWVGLSMTCDLYICHQVSILLFWRCYSARCLICLHGLKWKYLQIFCLFVVFFYFAEGSLS